MSVCESARNAAVVDLHAATGLGDFSSHFMDCAQCRLFLMRTRRMSASVRTEEPSAAEVLRLRVRLAPQIPGFGSARPAARHPILRPALALAFLLSATVAVASGGGARLLQAVGLQEPAPAAVIPPASPPRAALPHGRKPPGQPRGSEPAREVAPTPVEALALEPLVENGAASTAPVARAQGSAERQSEAGARGKPEGKWADVAASLRASDYERAHRSLGELARSSDPVTRDTARLSLAQLFLQQGKGSAARELLRELASSGATPFIRRRAGELLR